MIEKCSNMSVFLEVDRLFSPSCFTQIFYYDLKKNNLEKL